MSEVVTVRIFLASPSADTLEARARVVQVVDEINVDPQYVLHVKLDLRRWDDPARPVVCDRAGNPQQDIVKQVGSPGDCDLVIGIFAHTMGGTLPRDRFQVPEGRDNPWFCSEWEVAQGLDAKRAVWVFHDKRPLLDDSIDAIEKWLAVKRYINRFDPLDHSMLAGFNPFADLEGLAGTLRYVLRQWLSDKFIGGKDGQPHSNPRRLRELAHLDGLIERLSQHEPRYVPLGGEETPEQRLERVLKDLVMPSDFVLEAFGMDDSAHCAGHEPVEPVVYQDVLEAYRALPERHDVRRLAVLGEPGAGKSFSLGRIACELARKAKDDEKQPVPVFVALGLWTDANETLDAFLVRRSVPLLAEDLQTLRCEGRLLLVLDAVNEIPPGQRSAKVATIAELARKEGVAALVLSCRARDFEAELKSRLAFDTLKLLPLRPLQVRDFLRQSLVLTHGDTQGRRRAEDKFWQIAGGEAVREVWRVWERAGASFELFFTAEDIPKDEPNVFSKTSGVQDQLWRDLRHGTRSLIRLAENPFLLTVMMQLTVIPPNRAQLFGGFLKVLHERERRAREKRGDAASVPMLTAWRAVLVQVAEALQRVDGREGDDGARTALARADRPAALDEAMLVFSIDASVLQAVDGELRFAHQLLQESLAADVLLDASRSGRRPASDFWPEQRGWKRTGWEVVAEIAGEACGADEVAQHKLIEWLSASAPKVASDVWKHLNRPALPAELRQAIADQWCPRLTDTVAEPMPEARAAMGEWLGALDLDHRSGTGLRPDGVPDIDWVLIDDDRPFRYQDAEHPPLPRYEISRYPVTNRQWQAFIDDGGYDNGRWWDGLAERMKPQEPRWPEPTAPREMVSWYEAMAYGRWLSAKLNERVTLPTEQQWERAARGSEGREYPWGKDYVSGLATINETWTSVGMHDVGRTTAVGLYPHGATPEGIQDMAGNVWEWCLNEQENPQYIDLTGTARRVVRGGSWGDTTESLRASYRDVFDPDFRHSIIGLRLVRRVVPHSGHGSLDHRASDAAPAR